MYSDFFNNCYGRWTEILAHWIDNKFLIVGKHGPCPLCGGKDRYIYRDNGIGSWFCNQCNGQKGMCFDGIELLKKIKGWDFKECFRRIEPIIGKFQHQQKTTTTRRDDDKRIALRKICQESRPMVTGGNDFQYLENRCGDIYRPYLSNFLVHPNLFCSCNISDDGLDHKYPAMVAICRSYSMQATGIQATYITSDGIKANKKRWNYGQIGNGVWIGPKGGANEIVIAEGIETCLSAMGMTGLPGWATLGAGSMRTWEPGIGVWKCIHIYGDNDASFTGQAAAYHLAHALTRAGIKCDVNIPPAAGTDWNDFCIEEDYLIKEREGMKMY